MSPRASTRSASSRRAAPARRSPNGSRAAIRRSICGMSTSGACSRSRAPPAIFASARSRAWACSTPMHWPDRQYATARPARLSPLHGRLAARGACFAETAGWERPGWYGEAGTQPAYDYAYGRTAWFERVGGRAPCRARAGGPVRSVLVRQIPAPGARRGGGAAAGLGQRRRARTGSRRLYPMAERAGRHRGRPDRDAPRRRPLHGHDQRGEPDARLHWLQRHIPDGAQAYLDRRHLGLCGARPDGPASRDLLGPLTAPICPNGRSRSGPRRRSSSAMRWSGRSASPTSASSATSSMCRASSRGRCSI